MVAFGRTWGSFSDVLLLELGLLFYAIGFVVMAPYGRERGPDEGRLVAASVLIYAVGFTTTLTATQSVLSKSMGGGQV